MNKIRLNSLPAVSLFFLSLLFCMTGCTAYRVVVYNISGVNDFKHFPKHTLTPSQAPFHFFSAAGIIADTLTITSENKNYTLNEYLQKSKSLAFLIIRNDSLLVDNFYTPFRRTDISQAFSMSKSITSMLIGCAMDDGLIKSTDQPITDFIPELKAKGFDTIYISDLLDMTSNLNYKENDNPFGAHVKFYYTPKLEKAILKLNLSDRPKGKFVYKSGENALLGLILKRVLYPQTITQYLQNKIWNPAGMESSGVWTVDKKENGLEKTWCCLAASAYDFAKLGRLYLNEGNWNGKQLISKKWISASVNHLNDTTQNTIYRYQWWLYPSQNAYAAIGKGGQYIYVRPDKRIIIVRLGKNRGGKLYKKNWIQILHNIACQL
jgi:CubicO group peptidase (beta-lactamase class C family)